MREKKIMNQTIGKNYIAVKGRDTMRKIVSVTPGVVLTECKYKGEGWRYELWPTEPSECCLTFHTEEEQQDPYVTLVRLSRTLHSQLEREIVELNNKLKTTEKNLKTVSGEEPELPAADHDAPKNGISSRSMEEMA